MKILIYCVYNLPLDELEFPAGLDNNPLYQISFRGLTAAVSNYEGTLKIEIDKALAYEKIIEYFHDKRTVIPMRYGCLLDWDENVVNFLKGNFDEYGLLLERLRGCQEMGIRILLPEKPAASCIKKAAGDALIQIENPKPLTGKDYLLGRKNIYLAQDDLTAFNDSLSDKIKGHFEGIYTHHVKEIKNNLNGNYLISLFFLIPGDFVDQFRLRFYKIDKEDDVSLLLSGPWPPYNFVSRKNTE